MAVKKDNKKQNGGRKQTTSARRSYRKKKNKDLPRWIYVISATFLSFIFIIGSYYLFFRPYFYRFRPCFNHKYYEVCMPSGHSVYGIDVSRHQGDIDWERLSTGHHPDAPISFVYVKASEGSDFKDVKFKENFENARKHGFVRGAYHYFSTTSSGLSQANLFISMVKLRKGDLPPVLDIEEKPKNKKKYIEEVKVWLKKVEEHYGVKPIIYASSKYKQKYLDDPFFKEYPSWVAHYYIPELRKGEEWLMWQCTDLGVLPGIKEKVDINIFNGSKKQFENLLID
ncbi:MAG: glycoside hydrolase family 25 protein [Bacteroidaceae bacterium]|nr:glycoside hydrolase family 25 protein [Bacteroidaceae bacterium]